jgi:hypothetical protein
MKNVLGEQYSDEKALVDYVLNKSVLYGTIYSGEQSSIINKFVKQWFLLVYSIL